MGWRIFFALRWYLRWGGQHPPVGGSELESETSRWDPNILGAYIHIIISGGCSGSRIRKTQYVYVCERHKKHIHTHTMRVREKSRAMNIVPIITATANTCWVLQNSSFTKSL
jgi:hypothetical protein